jgi:hypothetical protein
MNEIWNISKYKIKKVQIILKINANARKNENIWFIRCKENP